MVAPTRAVNRRGGNAQLQLYIKIIIFYMAVVYFCVLHVHHAATHARKSEARLDARLDARLAREIEAARALQNFTAQHSELRPLQPAQQDYVLTKR